MYSSLFDEVFRRSDSSFKSTFSRNKDISKVTQLSDSPKHKLKAKWEQMQNSDMNLITEEDLTQRNKLILNKAVRLQSKGLRQRPR